MKKSKNKIKCGFIASISAIVGLFVFIIYKTAVFFHRKGER